jgi:F0F1-type ATP synthase assembly protein I
MNPYIGRRVTRSEYLYVYAVALALWQCGSEAGIEVILITMSASIPECTAIAVMFEGEGAHA